MGRILILAKTLDAIVPMRYILLPFFLLYFSQSFSQDFTVDREFERIEEIHKKLQNDSTESWYANEKRFFDYWSNGLRAETAKDYDEAIRLYELAINQSRGEIPSYYPLFSMGRTSKKQGNTKFATICFQRFIEFANSELKYDSPYTLPEEFKDQLREQIAEVEKK